MKVRFIGDVHGKYRRYRDVIRDVPVSLQVGDMGVGFYKMLGDEKIPYTNPPYDSMSRGEHYFIRGNHDNPTESLDHPFNIPDGVVWNGIFCVGGASSVDKQHRTEGLDWWPDEECSYKELEDIVEVYSDTKPDIIVTHEAPASIANQILSAFNMAKIQDGSRTRQALEVMLYNHQPRLWIFGHWHRSLSFKQGGTIFRCLNELEYEDYELDDFRR